MKSVDENIICKAGALLLARRSERRYAGQSMDDSLRQTSKEKHPDILAAGKKHPAEKRNRRGMMKTGILFLSVLFFPGMNVFAQEYYYWCGDEKIPLELLSTKKYILVHSPEDTAVLKERLTVRDIQAGEFVVERIKGVETEKHICWAIVESKESLPDLTCHEAILYEGPFFLDENRGRETGGLTESFTVMLKQAEDLPLLEQLAAENDVTIFGHILSDYPLFYWLDCTKASKGNAMELANQFHETGLFEYAQPGFSNYGSDAAPANINISRNDNLRVFAGKDILYLSSPVSESVSLYSCFGELLYKTNKQTGMLQIPLGNIKNGVLIVLCSSGRAKKVLIN